MGSNQRPPNPTNNSMAMQQQQQPQTGMDFPQNSVPFSNPNGQAMAAMPNMPLNHPNQLLQLQNIVLGMAQQMGMLNPAQFNMGGFGGLQNCVPNLNQAAMFPGQFGNLPQNANQVNSARPPGQFYGQNFTRFPHPMNQSNGQFGFPNTNQFMPVLGPNYNMFGCANQPAPAMAPQNSAFFPNPQFGQVNQNQQNLTPPAADLNAPLAAATQLLQGNSSAQQNQNLQPSTFTHSQGNPDTNGQTNSNWKNSPNGQTNSNWKNSPNAQTNNWKNSPNGKFMRNQKGEASQAGFQKSQFHRMKNTQRNFNEQKGQGMKNGRGNFDLHSTPDPTREQKRSLSLTYTEQEIQQWREERRKNHPSKNNTEKELTDKPSDPTLIDREAKLRRERLKEVLAKQAELGVEVAEIPSYYLSDSEKQCNGKEENRGASGKRGRFQNRQDKRARHNKKDRFAKKQKLDNKDSSNTNIPCSVKKPTLLEKLLSADIKRDKSHLLQVFRFMAMNSYFKDGPEKPLSFPLILVKENRSEVELATEKRISKGQEKTISGKFGNDAEHDQDVDDDENGKDLNNDDGNCKVIDEEEGEIID